MPVCISILRGINVSGQNKIGMAELRELYGRLGFERVETYIQSGNVIFSCPPARAPDIEEKISGALRESFGYEVPVIVLEREEFREIFRANPFPGDRAKEVSFMHVTFLSAVPVSPELDGIRQKQGPGEEFFLAGRAVYLYCPNGYGRTKLNNTTLENILKRTATTRNWRTVTELLRLADRVNAA